MDDAGTLERARSVLQKHKQWLQSHGQSPVVLDAEREESSLQHAPAALLTNGSGNGEQRLPLSANSPALPQRADILSRRQRGQEYQYSTAAAAGADGSRKRVSEGHSAEGTSVAGGAGQSTWRQGSQPILAWGAGKAATTTVGQSTRNHLTADASHDEDDDTDGRAENDAKRTAGNGFELSLASSERPADVDGVDFVPLASGQEQALYRRTAWSGSNIVALATARQGATRTVSPSASSERTASPPLSSSDGEGSRRHGAEGEINTKPPVEAGDAEATASSKQVSKHASRRQKQFRKRKVKPEASNTGGTPTTGVQADQDSSSSKQAAAAAAALGLSDSDRYLLTSPELEEPEQHIAVMPADGVGSRDQNVPRSPDSVLQIEIKPAAASTPILGGANRHQPHDDGPVIAGALPSLSNLPASPDSLKPVRPAEPPSYFLPAHQESRPLDMSALPCPLYGEFELEGDAPGKVFNAFVGKPPYAPTQQSTPAAKKEPEAAKADDAVIFPLHHAAWIGDVKRLKVLLQQGHSPDIQDKHGRTALMYSCSAHGTNIMCADVLLRSGARLDHQAKDGSTALHEAAYVGSLSLIELMLHNGASPQLQDREGRLPMHYGTYNKSSKCLAALIKAASVDIDACDKTGMTALMWAAYHDKTDVCTFLLKHGADREEKDVDGRTAMHWAVHKSSISCLKLLLEHDMTYFKDHKGLTVLHIAAEEGSIRAARFILSLREDSVHDLDRQGRSPLHWAAVSDRVDVCALLLEYGASPNLKDKTNRSPLDYAKKQNLVYVVGLLTCFDWDSRPQMSASSSRLSLLNRWSSRVSPMPAAAASSQNADTVSIASQQSVSHLSSRDAEQRVNLPDDYRRLLEDGTYMKVFTDNGTGRLQDKYFWVSFEHQQICWSKRRADRILGDYSSAKAISVVAGVQDVVKERSDFSADLSRNQLALTMTTSSFILSALAYTAQHFKAWVQGLGAVLQDERKGDVRPLSPLWAGDAWGEVNQRTTTSVQHLFQSTAKRH